MGMSLIVEKRALRSGARPRAGSRRSASQAARRDATSDGFDVDRSVMAPTLAPGGAVTADPHRRSTPLIGPPKASIGGLDLRVGQVVGDDDIDDVGLGRGPDDDGLLAGARLVSMRWTCATGERRRRSRRSRGSGWPCGRWPHRSRPSRRPSGPGRGTRRAPPRGSRRTPRCRRRSAPRRCRPPAGCPGLSAVQFRPGVEGLGAARPRRSAGTIASSSG